MPTSACGARRTGGAVDNDVVFINENLDAPVFGTARFRLVIGDRRAFAVADGKNPRRIDFSFRHQVSGDVLGPALGKVVIEAIRARVVGVTGDYIKQAAPVGRLTFRIAQKTVDLLFRAAAEVDRIARGLVPPVKFNTIFLSGLSRCRLSRARSALTLVWLSWFCSSVICVAILLT